MGQVKTIDVGKCESCKHYYIDSYDPSPAGISLGSGWMTDEGCKKEDEVFAYCEQKNLAEECRDMGGKVACPMWEPMPLRYCLTHKLWHDGECDPCMEEAYANIVPED